MFLTFRLPRYTTTAIFLFGFLCGAAAVWSSKGCHFVGDPGALKNWEQHNQLPR